jgi:hypothetical protein|eukprot:CAMPEP_0175105284 /NCGR_PEP_ID=MMETSP0086_2-20121207/10340_1 /TAXON_ID=136419 /ORGANISM="Unknown Unknown, Strain D1" /LENGTH=272 /DNA_ID=CAMNT_0016381055 /DNA_START=41 /DNA_END=859 /DNA_ORIENTATION=+
MQSFSDFISKNFTFSHSVKTINKADGNVKIENGVESTGTALKGWTKANFPAADLGKAEVQVCANGADKDTKAKLEFSSCGITGVDLTLSANASPNVTVEAAYAQNNFGLKSEINTDLGAAASLKQSLWASHSGVKATADLDVCLAAGELKDYNLKVDYKQKDLQASMKTSNGRNVLTGWVAQNFCPGFYWGAQVQHNLAKSATVGAVGASFKIDDATVVHKLVNTDGQLQVAVEHRLSNPAVKVNSACEFDVLGSNCCAAKKYGFGITFGDF